MTLRASKPAFNVREKLTELGRRFGLKGSELVAAETVQDARNIISVGRRNIIINGNFDIWQRGTSTTGALSNAYASADRWMFNTRSLTTRNISRQAFTNGQTDVPGNPIYYLRFETSNDSGSYGAYMMQRIEDVRVGAGEDVTVSFYAKANSGGGTFQAAFSQQFGSGGSSSTDDVAGSFTPTSSWKKFSFTISLPSISGKTIGTNNYLRLDIRFPSNTAVTLDISKIQVERGRNATDFEHRSYGEELALCQRYYQKMYFTTSDYPFGYCYTYNQGNSACAIPLATPIRTSSPQINFSTLRIRGYNQNGVNNSQNISNITGQTQEGHALLQADLTHNNVGAANIGAASVLTNGVSNSTSYLEIDAEL